VTGVQTCALPISRPQNHAAPETRMHAVPDTMRAGEDGDQQRRGKDDERPEPDHRVDPGEIHPAAHQWTRTLGRLATARNSVRATSTGGGAGGVRMRSPPEERAADLHLTPPLPPVRRWASASGSSRPCLLQGSVHDLAVGTKAAQGRERGRSHPDDLSHCLQWVRSYLAARAAQPTRGAKLLSRATA